MKKDKGRGKKQDRQQFSGERDDAFADQRNPLDTLSNRPRHWQGPGYGERGEFHDEPEFDQRAYGVGNQYGRAGEYARQQGYGRERDRGFDGGNERKHEFGRGDETMRDERDSDRPYPGAHAARPGERLRSRSADPGQSSYGGFTNEDPRFQEQQFERFQGGRGFGGYHHSAQGGQQQGGEVERQRWAYGSERVMPKGYTRSDERIREDICERLSHSGLDVSDVSVEVAEGHVSLQGTVGDRRTKHTVEDYADACSGVQDIDNRIMVRRGNRGAGDISVGE